MQIFINILLVIVGIAVTIGGASILVDGASKLAKRFGVSDLIIGLTIVAFGTSSPELAVNVSAAFSGSVDIAVGNIIGSNIFNIFLILGIAAVIYPIDIQSKSVWIEIPLSLLAAIMVTVFASDIFLDRTATNVISRTDALGLLGFFIVFMYYTVLSSRNEPNKDALAEEIAEESKDDKPMSLGKSILFIVGGLVGLYFGSQWMVEGAKFIASAAGMSDALIGLTIVAAGTSMPEIATSATAAFKKNSDIAIGNVVGSNIFNGFFILGLTGTIMPLPYQSPTAVLDHSMNMFASLLLFAFAFSGKKRNQISRIEGGIFILVYVGYLGYLISTIGK